MKYSLCGIALAIILVLVLGAVVSDPLDDYSPAIYSSDGRRFAARQILKFPLQIETSSLAYDDSTGTFYTTNDKDTPHIVEFRLIGDSIAIVRADTIRGVWRNRDFEGIEVVNKPGRPRFLQVTTERWRLGDSVKIIAASIDGFQLLHEQGFAVRPYGLDDNNTFEGVTYDPANDFIVLGKEHSPFGIYAKPENSKAREIAISWHFNRPHGQFIDSVFKDILPADRRAILKQVSISGMAYDNETKSVLILNRYGRSVISIQILPGQKPPFQIIDIWPYEGIDDDVIGEVDPAMLVYGIVEGLAVWDDGSSRMLALITDPGAGSFPTLYILPYPRRHV